MSFFSKIRAGREAAKAHNAARVEREKQESAKPPYKHVPTHAAIDAMSSGPASNREADRIKILEQNRRRSTLTASGIGMSGMMTPRAMSPGMMTPGTSTPVPGMPRVNSSLSYVSYPSTYAASPAVAQPRAHNYGNGNPTWEDQAAEGGYAVAAQPSSLSLKGKQPERPGVMDQVNSAASSAGSTSSQDELEIKTASHGHSIPSVGSVPEGRSDYFHKLHPSQSRKASGASSPNHYSSQPRTPQMSHGLANGRPGGNMVAPSGGIPPVPALPPLQLQVGNLMSGSAVSSSTVSVASSNTAAVPKKAGTSIRENDMAVESDVAFSTDDSEREDHGIGAAITSPTATYWSAGKKARRGSKSARFADLETINSHGSVPSEVASATETIRGVSRPRASRTHSVISLTGVQLPPTMVGPDSLPEPVRSPGKNGKLSKNNAPESPVSTKKSQWTFKSHSRNLT